MGGSEISVQDGSSVAGIMRLVFCNAVFWKASQNCISSSMVDLCAQALAETYFFVLSTVLEMGLTIFSGKS